MRCSSMLCPACTPPYDAFLPVPRPCQPPVRLPAFPTGQKKKWNEGTVNKMLSNEKYMGDALLQKTYTADFLTKKRSLRFRLSSCAWLASIVTSISPVSSSVLICSFSKSRQHASGAAGIQL